MALLLSDGTVLVLGDSGVVPEIGDVWHRLTPDATGSCMNGTLSGIAPMIDTREYFSSQVLIDGRAYVAGGVVSDGNSEMLPAGRVLQAILTGNLKKTRIYDPVANT